ncbi:ParB/RepB/Spo0J family partition protein [Rhodococcus sp. NPDC003318]|uniref:ParB/RepB/Spo0J family partition protein n=1 Tax=Rhodococcus sp. NPDC003318 TaxID=3364503 RepID=UPI0036B8C6D8
MTNTATPALVHIDPTELLVDINIRGSLRLTADFLASIAEQGVIQPPTAVRTADGALRVRTGHRRTAAAVQAALPTIPVLVIGDEATDDAATIDRLVAQWSENEHRTGLAEADKLDTIEQLSLLGVSAAQIAKRTKTQRRDVDAALAITGNADARRRLDDGLTLDQAAAFAEFEGDEDAARQLEFGIRAGRLDHTVQRLRDRRAEAEARRAAAADYIAQGITNLDSRPSTYSSPARALDRLVTEAGDPATIENVDNEHLVVYMEQETTYHLAETGDEIDYDDIDFEAETGEDAEEGYTHHDAAEERTTWTPEFYCLDPAAAGLREPGHSGGAATDDDGKEAARAERRRVIANNKAWGSAETVRMDWLKKQATRKTAPKGAAAFIANTLATRAQLLTSYRTGRIRNDILGTKDADTTSYRPEPGVVPLIAKASDARALVLSWIQTLAAHEAVTNNHCWRNYYSDTAHYLRYIESLGYTLSEIEEQACGNTPKITG